MPQVFSFLLFGGSNLVKVQFFLFFGEFLGGLRKVLRKKKKKNTILVTMHQIHFQNILLVG